MKNYKWEVLVISLILSFLTIDCSTPKNCDLVCLDTNEYSFSSNENFIIVILDAVDANYFSQELSDEDNISFKDFTLFTDALGSYPYTLLAVPQILTGQWYTGGQSIHNFLNSNLHSSPLFSQLNIKSYQLGLYDEDLYFDSSNYTNYFVNYEPVVLKSIDKKQFLAIVQKMGGIQYYPWSLKTICSDLADRCQTLKTSSIAIDPSKSLYSWDDVEFYHDISDTMSAVIIPEKQFKFIHLEGSHYPYDLDAEMVRKENDTSYSGKIQSSIVLCKSFVSYLRNIGAYDNSVIVFMSDHGRQVSPALERGMSMVRMHPFLMIKGFGESKDKMTITDVPFSYENIQDVFLKLLEGDSGNSISANIENFDHRKCYLYDLEHEEKIEECLVLGKADDVSSFCRTGNVVIGYP